jgi:formylglycine-generating enzyme required for sulfatase activity
MTLKELLLQLHQDLSILLEREAKHGGNTPLDLLHEINDHRTAIELIESTLSTELTESDLARLKAAFQPLLLARRLKESLDTLKTESPPLPFEPETTLISAGPFWLGSQPGPDVPSEETPRHEITLPDYAIGQYPVTNAQYAEFLKQEKQYEVPHKGGWFLRQPPAEKLDHPVVGVSWDDALAYCRWLSQVTGRAYRLPSEAEWEKAARGLDGRLYPWGDTWEAGHCNNGSDETTPVTAFPAGASPYGCLDMAGNVQEWTNTIWGSDPQVCAFPYPYQVADGREDLAADQRLHRVYRVYRGGSFRDEPFRLRCAARGCSTPDSKIRWRGFRVALSV